MDHCDVFWQHGLAIRVPPHVPSLSDLWYAYVLCSMAKANITLRANDDEQALTSAVLLQHAAQSQGCGVRRIEYDKTEVLMFNRTLTG